MPVWKRPKEPLAIPKAIKLRERARALKAQAEALLKKADTLLGEAEKIEGAEKPKKKPREDVNQAAARTIREATKDR